MKCWSIKTFSSHFITGTREELEGKMKGEVEEERNEAEEEKRLGGDGRGRTKTKK